MKTLPIGATVETLRPGRDGILRGRVVREETDHYYQSRGLKSYVIRWTTPALGPGGGWLADDVTVIRANPASKAKAPPKDPPYGSPAYWAIKDAEADARKYHDWERSRSEPYGRKANPVIRPTGSYTDQDKQERAVLARLQAIHDRIVAATGPYYARDLATLLEHAKGYAFGLPKLRRENVKWAAKARAAEADNARWPGASRSATARMNPAPYSIHDAERAARGPTTSRMKAANYRKAAKYLDQQAGYSERELSPTHATVLSIRAEAADWRRKADLLDLLRAKGVIKNPAKRRKTGAKRKSFQAQEILLDKDTFTLSRAREWLKKNGKKYGKITDGDMDWHAEQHPADDYQPLRQGGYGGFHTIQLAKHIQARVGIPKSGSDAAEAAGYNTKGPGLFGNRKASGPATVADYNAEDVLY